MKIKSLREEYKKHLADKTEKLFEDIDKLLNDSQRIDMSNELQGLRREIARLKHSIDETIFTVKALIAQGCTKDDIEEAVEYVKRILSKHWKELGEQFVIEKGLELQNAWEDFLDMDIPDIKGE